MNNKYSQSVQCKKSIDIYTTAGTAHEMHGLASGERSEGVLVTQRKTTKLKVNRIPHNLQTCGIGTTLSSLCKI